MTTSSSTCLAIAAVLTASVSAQGPLLTMTPAVSLATPGAQVQWTLAGPIASPHAILVDTRGGPVEINGVTFLLGLSPALTTAELAATAPNGMFRLGTGASTIFHAAPAAVVLDFTNPVANGFQGNFRDDIPGHVRGGIVLHSSRNTLSPAGALFGAGIQSPLIPAGCREQMVFRPQDIGANGEPELVTGVSWLVAGLAQTDSFAQFELRMGHTNVMPDYSVDPWSALAVAPGSGLSSLFANNEIPGAPPVTVYLGRYDINPAAAIPSWLGQMMPYPAIVPFAYDGASSLLLDFRASQGLTGLNGMKVQLMVQSGPLPAARAVAGGTWSNPRPLPNPGSATQANLIDCAMPVLQFEFARVETHARSPWLDSGRLSPDYRAPLLAASMPLGTSVELRFRGSYLANGSGATAWSTNQDIADGMRYLQVDVRLRGNHMTDAVPIVDTLVVPVY
jgi:hypothetical protein